MDKTTDLISSIRAVGRNIEVNIASETKLLIEQTAHLGIHWNFRIAKRNPNSTITGIFVGNFRDIFTRVTMQP